MTGTIHKERPAFWIVIGALVVATLACYWPVSHFDFINIDDNIYVTQSSMVRHGLTWPGVVWAFKSTGGGNWNPLVWLSHMLDCQLYGMSAGGHHMTNVLLHALDAVLVFVVLRSLTKALWPSALVATIFALHPMHLESVAWISERKDVLSALFWWLTIWAYAVYVRSTGPKRARFYLLALIFFVLGLMSKPMLVTLPFVLLLIDYWPLQRTDRMQKWILEKIPFAVLSAGICALTVFAQKTEGAIYYIPFSLRAENAVVSYCAYLEKLFWPTRLAIFYPFPKHVPLWQWMVALITLVVVSIAATLQMRCRRYIFVGWFWFVGTLIPVIGFLQVGMQSHADRYSYIPYAGLTIIIAWGLAEVVAHRKNASAIFIAVTAAAGVACFAVTSTQIGYWHDNITLLERALEVTTDNSLANENLGVTMAIRGDIDRAIGYFREAIRIDPRSSSTLYNLGKALMMKHQYDKAIAADWEAIRADPKNPKALNNLAWAYATCSRADLRNGPEAVRMATRACEITGNDSVEYLDTLAAAYAETGDFPRAIEITNKILVICQTEQDAVMLKMERERLTLYQTGKPYHED